MAAGLLIFALMPIGWLAFYVGADTESASTGIGLGALLTGIVVAVLAVFVVLTGLAAGRAARRTDG